MAFPSVTPKPELAAMVGSEARPTSELTKKLWEYIKSVNGLQQGRRIAASKDAKFQAAVKAAKLQQESDGTISMFHIAKMIGALSTK